MMFGDGQPTASSYLITSQMLGVAITSLVKCGPTFLYDLLVSMVSTYNEDQTHFCNFLI